MEGSTPFPWRSATYLAWNERLVDYFLGRRRRGHSVGRIAATPEELREAVGDPEADASGVVSAFIASVRGALPHGVSLCRYCLEYEEWRPHSKSDLPHFFAILWMDVSCCFWVPGRGRRLLRTAASPARQARQPRDRWGDLPEPTLGGPRGVVRGEPRVRPNRTPAQGRLPGPDRTVLLPGLPESSRSRRLVESPPRVEYRRP